MFQPAFALSVTDLPRYFELRKPSNCTLMVPLARWLPAAAAGGEQESSAPVLWRC
jgi:hypothetical protein